MNKTSPILSAAEVDYLKCVFNRHIKLHYTNRAVEAFCKANIVWAKWSEIANGASFEPGTIVIPLLDIDDVIPTFETNEVTFYGTTLTIWGRLPTPKSWANHGDPNALWYSNGHGAYLASWDLAGIIFNLLTLEEERDDNCRDKHGRFIAEMSPRLPYELLSIPIFNNAVAAIVDLCLQIQGINLSREEIVKPVKLCISHDLDQLRGDDFWTQLSRVGRMLKPLAKFKAPDFFQLKYIVKNIRSPRKSFMDDLLGMLEVERELGFRSSQYVLCGKKGRFGARTSDAHIAKYLAEIPQGWDVGIHYNYDTHLDSGAFQSQMSTIESMIGKKVTCGRAHYLRMDPNSSFQFWDDMGVRYDESLGYPDHVGYRAGIAGPYKIFNRESQQQLSLTSVPLIAMDSCIGDKYGKFAVNELEEMISHLSVVGGTFTLLFHPGRFDNDEFPNTQNLYEEILLMCKKYNVQSILPTEIES
ncbi:DUF7033 domain-containing protein [Neptuniibacter sp. SY11_33]|uniref:DUF7033 domain-containing protein n=1 Tax=Neptuniibacter sp. SY11_33 TaxID=3398215 RepID=UPI0039F5C75C